MPTDDPVGAFVEPPSLLRTGEPGGPLAGRTVGVKDLFDLAGLVTGAGNPSFAAAHAPATTDATAVTRLVAAGADVVGHTVTDELAYSLAGRNLHYGTPRNVAAPGRRAGGSSSGSAAAVAAELVDIGLGTDTGGSIRVPASQCGLFGWRPTHGVVPIDGVVPLAPSFDTVGLLARTLAVLTPAARALWGDAPSVPLGAVELVLMAEAWALADVDAATASAVLPTTARVETVGVDLAGAADAFRALQGREAWTSHGAWIRETAPELGPDVAARFAAAAAVTDTQVDEAAAVADDLGRHVRRRLDDGVVLVLPAAPGAAPPLDQAGPTDEAWRARALQLTCVPGLVGLPVVVAPMLRSEALPFGLAFVGPRRSDLALLALVEQLTAPTGG